MVLDNTKFTTPLLSKRSSFWKNHQTLSNGIQFELSQYKIINRDEQNDTNNRLSWKDLLPQILASVVAFMLVTQPGMNMVYSNIFLSHHQSTDVSELSSLTGIMVICTPIGAIMIGVVMDRIGRKNAFLLTCVILLISWSIASMAQGENAGLNYLCRFFAGIGGGMTSMAVIYVSEITHSSYKQVLLSLNSVFFSLGILFATTVGSMFRWHAVNMIFFCFTAVITVLSAVFLPESPVWLTKFRVDRAYEARSSLKRIYPKNDQIVTEEWDRLYNATTHTVQEAPVSVQLNDLPPRDHSLCRARVRRFWQSLRSTKPPTVTGPVRVLAFVFLLQQLSGCYPVIFYAVPIFQSVIGTTETGGLSEMDVLITLGVVRLLTSVVACALSLHVGRRPLLIVSSLAMACSAALVALTCPSTDTAITAYDEYDSVDGVRSTPLLPLFGVIAFVCSSSAGVLVFPWTLVGELLPADSGRAVAGALLVAYAYSLMFVVLKAFPYFITSDYGGGGGDSSIAMAFATFATVSTAMAVYVHAYLPETLGRRFHEIQEYFTNPTLDAKTATTCR